MFWYRVRHGIIRLCNNLHPNLSHHVNNRCSQMFEIENKKCEVEWDKTAHFGLRDTCIGVGAGAADQRAPDQQ